MIYQETAKQDLLGAVNAFIREAHLDQALGVRLRAFFRYSTATATHLNAMQARLLLLLRNGTRYLFL